MLVFPDTEADRSVPECLDRCLIFRLFGFDTHFSFLSICIRSHHCDHIYEAAALQGRRLPLDSPVVMPGSPEIGKPSRPEPHGLEQPVLRERVGIGTADHDMIEHPHIDQA